MDEGAGGGQSARDRQQEEQASDQISEAQFSRLVAQFARKRGWLVYRVAKTKFRRAGFPDLLMLRDGVQIVAELKTGSGKLSEEQRMWLDEFGKCKATQAYLWRPKDWQIIQELLQ